MLHVTTGHFHPELEETLALDLQSIKAEDPFSPVAIIVPSEPLRDRLKWFLACESQIPILNVHFLTFHHLAVKLLQEGEPDTHFPIRSDFYFQELIHQLLIHHPTVVDQWQGLVNIPGAWAALWSTLKDVKDAKVTSTLVQEMLDQQGANQSQELECLLAMYELLRNAQQQRQSFDRDDMATRAEPYVDSSSFLKRQKKIVYYGFYDITQVQLDSVSGHSPAVSNPSVFSPSCQT